MDLMRRQSAALGFNYPIAIQNTTNSSVNFFSQKAISNYWRRALTEVTEHTEDTEKNLNLSLCLCELCEKKLQKFSLRAPRAPRDDDYSCSFLIWKNAGRARMGTYRLFLFFSERSVL